MPCKILIIATVQSHIGQFHKPLMKLLKENGWEIHAAARNNLAEKDGLQLEYPDRIFDVPFQRSPFDRRNITAYRLLRKVLSNDHYDVVFCNTPVGGILGRLAARQYRKNGTKVYYMAHGFHFYRGAPKKNWLYFPIEKGMAHFTDKLITINQEDYELAMQKFSCPVFRIHGVGANSQRYRILSSRERDELRQRLKLTGCTLLIIGELLPNKNQKTAIFAVKEISKSHPDVVLLIAGNGPERENLVDIVKRENLEDHVRFLGYTTDVASYIQASNTVITCSYREGLPLNVVEAMLCGIPVVASNNRGHRELIKHGMNGFLVDDPDDLGAYAEYICKLLDGPEEDREAICESVQAYTDSCVCEELRDIFLNEVR